MLKYFSLPETYMTSHNQSLDIYDKYIRTVLLVLMINKFNEEKDENIH